MTKLHARDFLTSEERGALRAVLRKRKEAGLTVRRANALLLLDGGWDAERVAEALFLDEETVREWRRAYAADGSASLGLKGYAPREGHLSSEREAELARLLRADPPRTTGAVRQLIETRFGVTYSISGAIALMHRLGFCWRKPKHLPLGADEAAQAAHIAAYERLLNALGPDETVVFADAVHPEHQSRPAHGWFPVDEEVALKAASGRRRINIHAAFKLETSALTWVEDLQISGETTRRLLEKLERDYPDKRSVHVFLLDS